MLIKLTDNNCDGLSDGKIYSRQDVDALFPLADKKIKDLCKENEHLLIFPYSISDTEDKIGDETVFNIVSTRESDNVRIGTGNLMGFIGIGDLQIKIQSRFDKNRDDYLLHYMLQRVMSFNLFDLNHNNAQEDVFDFIMFLFPSFLKEAMRQGLYREYQNFKHNDTNIKGPIDIGRHIARNIPFRGNFAYSTREYSQENNLTELIRHTIEFMKTKKYGQSILNIDSETAQNVETIVEHTPNYNKNDRNIVISKNLRMKIHPYYTGYRPLQTLCLQILRMEEVKYGDNEEELNGILFDGAWLWEEYINTLLRKVGFKHAENKKSLGRICIFEGNRGYRYPDFYKEDAVLDAKYKRIGDCKTIEGVGRDDIHQVYTYAAALKSKMCGFVAPLEEKQLYVPTETLVNTDATMSIFGVEISKNVKSYSDFCEEMKVMEKTFVESLQL